MIKAKINLYTQKIIKGIIPVFLIYNLIFSICLYFNLRDAYTFFDLVAFIYNINTIYLPIFLLLITAIGLTVVGSDRKIIKGIILCFIAALLLAGIRIYATHIEPYNLKIRRISIKSDKITKPLKILHITDIQSETIGDYERKVFKTINDLQPDLIIHTGDLVSVNRGAKAKEELRKMRELIETLKPPLGLLGVNGDVDMVLHNMKESKLGGLDILRSEEFVIVYEGMKIKVFGLNLKDSERGHPELIKKWFKTTSEAELTILAGHFPDYVMDIKELPIDLCLAGHTHGGQIRLPFLGPILTYTKVPRKWARGFRKVGNTNLNVSAGIGCEHCSGVPPIRFNCPPEMTLFEFTNE